MVAGIATSHNDGFAGSDTSSNTAKSVMRVICCNGMHIRGHQKACNITAKCNTAVADDSMFLASLYMTIAITAFEVLHLCSATVCCTHIQASP